MFHRIHSRYQTKWATRNENKEESIKEDEIGAGNAARYMTHS